MSSRTAPSRAMTQTPADAHHQAVEGRCPQSVLGGEGFHSRQHDAVGDDQRDEYSQHQVQVVEEGVEGQIDDVTSAAMIRMNTGMRIS
jgi:hypothetical protein